MTMIMMKKKMEGDLVNLVLVGRTMRSRVIER